MSWGSAAFISGFGAWLAGGTSTSDDASAEELAKFYGLAAKTVNPSSFSAIPIATKPDQIIASGFIASFKLGRLMTVGVPTSAIWLPAAAAIVTYWTAVPFTPMPPAPGGLIGAINITTFPGLPTPLNIQIGVAFTQEDPFSVASDLSDAFKNHLMMVTGLWTGTAPAAPSPIPYVSPWVGLK
jgi:hypothetical protein